MSWKTTLTSVLSTLALSAFLSGCGGNASSDETTSTSSEVSPSTTSVPATTAQTETTAAAPGDIPNVSAPQTGETRYLTDVRVAHQPEGDRVTFEFQGGTPGYDIGYATMPPRQDGSGNEVPVAGNAGLAVRFLGASTVNLTGGLNKTYNGPDRVTAAGTTAVTEVVKVSDFEAQLVWTIGTKERRPFEVSTQSNPARVVIDFR